MLGTSVSLTGQRLINGITKANTYSPRVNGPSQVISLSPLTLPGLNVSAPRPPGKSLTSVAGQASYVDSAVGPTSQAQFSPQVLLDNLPATLQPSSTLFYYNPQEEDLLLQQAALKQTGKASFVDGLSYDSKSTLSVTEQEKAYLYGNALDYAKQNDVRLGQALTEAQVGKLDKPMLWYVEQTVPDPSCSATGAASCPTITALMPQVYLPSTASALPAGGYIIGQDVTLNFGGNGQGSIVNTGSISASGTLTVNTPTLTNQANQVDVGQIWSKVKGGYVDTTGTVVQPGGFMSAANMDLNVQTLSQIGGALQKLNADGTIDQAGTQQVTAALQQQLGGNFTQMALTDHLHTDFVKDGGGLPTFVVAAIAIAATIATSGAAAAAMGTTLSTMTLGQSIAVAALSGMAGSAASQLASGQGLNFDAMLEAGAIAAITAGLTNGITYNGTTGEFGLNNLNQALNNLPSGTSTLGQLAGISNIGRSLGQVAQAGATTAASLPSQLTALGATAAINAGVETAVTGGNFLNNLKGAALSDIAAVGAYGIGDGTTSLSWENILGHTVLGCAASALGGTGCEGGAIGGAVSALTANEIATAVTGGQGITDQGQLAAITAATMLLGGTAAGLLGQNATAAATAAENETLNNTCAAGHNCGTLKSALADTGRAAWNTALGIVQSIPNAVNGALPGYPDYVPFLQNAMLPYDDPDFGSLVSLVGAVGAGALAGGSSAKAATAEAYAYDAMNPGPLPNSVAGTFAGGRYSVGTIQSSDQILFKAGDAHNPGGSFFSFEMPQSVAQTRIDNAVKPYWIDPTTGAKTGASPINSVITAQFPAGTTYYYGPVGTQGGIYVGGQNSIQIFIPSARSIGTFTPIKPLK